MAKRTWIGNTTATQAQIWKGTITTTTTGHTYTATFTAENGATYVFSYALVAADTTTTLAAASWVVAFNLNQNNLISKITASSSGAIITLTADSAGVPFYVTATGGTGTWSTTGNTQTSYGPNDYASTSNWLEGAVPVADDVVYLTGTSAILYGLNQSAVELDGFFVMPGYSGQIGSDGAFLRIDVEDALRFEFSGTGSSWIDLGGAAVSPVIKKTKTVTGGQAGLYLRGSALVTVDLQTGVLRLDTATVTTLLVATAGESFSATATAYVTAGCTLTTLHNSGGDVRVEIAVTTINNQAGTLTTEGSGTVTTLNIDGGVVVSNSSGTITTVNADGGTLDLTRSRINRTVSTLNYRGATVKLDPNVITVTTPVYIGPHSITPLALAA